MTTIHRFSVTLALCCSLVSAVSADPLQFGNFNYEVVDDTSITILKYLGTAVEPVVIPASIEGKPVTVIGDEAFAQCIGLTSVTIPGTVIEIRGDAFSGCHALTSVSIPDSVTTIGNYAFFDCTVLSAVTFPSSITSIGQRALDDCPGLVQAVFLGDEPSMGETVFPIPLQNPAFSVYYFSNKTGFATPTWTIPGSLTNIYPAEPMDNSETIAYWLIAHGLPANSNMTGDEDGDGVSLLMAYALNLDPRQNLSASLPKPVFSPTQMSLSFYSGRPGITYAVVTSDDLSNWTPNGISLSAPDVNQVRTATASRTGPQRFMRLEVRN